MSNTDTVEFDSDDGSNSVISQISIEQTSRFKWKSSLHYIFAVAVYCTTLSDYSRSIDTNLKDPNTLQVAVCLFVIGMPLLYMQLAVGQYVKVSGMHLRYMCPAARGLGLSFVLSTMLHMIPSGVLLGDAMLYFFNCFQSELPWLKCNADEKELCWEGFHCETTTPCIDETRIPSAHFYWKHTFMEISYGNAQKMSFRRPVTVCILWILLYICTFRIENIANKVFRYSFYIGMCMLIVITVALIVHHSSNEEKYSYLMSPSFTSLVSFHTWITPIPEVVCLLNISQGSQILLGSYLDNNASSGGLAAAASLVMLIITMFCMSLLHVSFTILLNAANLSWSESQPLNYLFDTVTLQVIPFALGKFELRQFWSGLYFLSIIILTSIYIMINIKTLEASLEDSHPILEKYRKYLFICHLLLCLLVSFFHSLGPVYNYTQTFVTDVLETFDICVAAIFVTMVSWVYNLSRFSDDIHFITGSQPALFWKILWFLLPVFLLGSSYHKVTTLLKRSNSSFSFLALALLFSPLIIFAILEFISYARQKRLMDLTKPGELWGPPNYTDRHLREVYNPRKETRSCRRSDVCLHKCLLHSRTMKRVLDREYKMSATRYDPVNL